MKTNPKVYVIIINWNGYIHTKACIKSVLQSDFTNIKIVLIDNGSINNEGFRLKKLFPKIILIENKFNEGFSKANNQGITYALKHRAKYIFILNNDTIVENQCIKMLVSHCETYNYIGLITPKILFYNTNLIWSLGGKHQKITSIPRLILQNKPSNNVINRIIYPEFITGCAFFVHRNVFRKIGLFDEDYFAYHEDIDFSYRAKRAGYKLIAFPKSIVWHKVSKSTKQKPNKVGELMGYLMARNGIVFGYKNISGIRGEYYMFAQIFIKTPLYILLKCNDNRSRISYIKGIADGIKYVFGIENNLDLNIIG